MQNAPIALFVYNRLKHTQQTIDALRNNYFARDSELFIFSDGPKDQSVEKEVSKVRACIKNIAGFRSVTIVERDRNLGLSQSIIEGITELISRYGKVIVLEDDLITSPYFLQFMNDALLAYKDEERIISICGYLYPINRRYSDILFLRIPDCWGWATWKRGWDLFEADGKKLYDELKARKLLLREFNLEGAFNFTKMLKAQIEGRNDSWAVRWYASAILNRKLSLYPYESLVMNIGIEGSGRHCGIVDCFKAGLANEQISVHKTPIVENKSVLKEIRYFLWKQRFNICNKVLVFFRNRAYNKTLSIWRKMLLK